MGEETYSEGFVYDDHGRLTSKTVTQAGTETTVTNTYDASGNPYALTYTNGTETPVTYYYVVNLQGDVIRLVSTNGASVAQYWYGPYGEVRQAFGAMAEANPLRYRGYYYDADTEFYYLQSRYYDPAICRFINADAFASTGQGFLGLNMFAYCANNPINLLDPSGAFFLDAAFELLNQWLNGVEDEVSFAVDSAISKAMHKSKKLKEIAEKALDEFKKTGKSTSSGYGEFTADEDGWNLYLSTQHFYYDVTVRYEYEIRDEIWSLLFGLTTPVRYERYVVTIVITDIYNFDNLRDWDGVGNCLNNIAYLAHILGTGHDYTWDVQYTYSTEWRRTNAL